jgi:hypothetical protein
MENTPSTNEDNMSNKFWTNKHYDHEDYLRTAEVPDSVPNPFFLGEKYK